MFMTEDRSFLATYREIVGDLIGDDLPATLGDIDPEMAAVVRAAILDAFVAHQATPDALISSLEGLILAHFFAGRQHALRGYPAPVERDFELPEIPDLLDDIRWS